MSDIPHEFIFHMREGQEDFSSKDVADDTLDKFLGDCALAAAIGRHGDRHVEAFREEVAHMDAHVREVYKARAAKAHQKSQAQNEWNEEIGGAGDSQRLAKRAPRTDTHFHKSENGRWLFEYDSRGELVSGREIES